ncbi:hypothetical protein [Salmonirosea aquatica]|uniref:Uncharacterized protein n=1 Tax=Salmonirosea aquatica TaxID=2654236 RepID=A0A7C9FS27_9BACT|nr:hypothetical protein [Cytophagaceae bacterium SJW1-29]
MDEQKEHPHIHFLRERSLWTDVKGRKLLVLRHYFAWNGAAHVVSSLDLVLLDELAMITRPRAELAALVADGKMKYDGELAVKVPLAVPSGVVPQLAGAEN